MLVTTSEMYVWFFLADKREVPRGKPVASFLLFLQSQFIVNVTEPIGVERLETLNTYGVDQVIDPRLTERVTRATMRIEQAHCLNFIQSLAVITYEIH